MKRGSFSLPLPDGVVVQVHAGGEDPLLVEHLDLELVLARNAASHFGQPSGVSTFGGSFTASRAMATASAIATPKSSCFLSAALVLPRARWIRTLPSSDLGLALAGEVFGETVSTERDGLADRAEVQLHFGQHQVQAANARSRVGTHAGGQRGAQPRRIQLSGLAQPSKTSFLAFRRPREGSSKT